MFGNRNEAVSACQHTPVKDQHSTAAFAANYRILHPLSARIGSNQEGKDLPVVYPIMSENDMQALHSANFNFISPLIVCRACDPNPQARIKQADRIQQATNILRLLCILFYTDLHTLSSIPIKIPWIN